MYADQTAPILFVGKASKTFQLTTKADNFCCYWHFKGLFDILVIEYSFCLIL